VDCGHNAGLWTQWWIVGTMLGCGHNGGLRCVFFLSVFAVALYAATDGESSEGMAIC